MPVTLEEPRRAGGDEEVVARYVDYRLWQQSVPQHLAEREHLLLVKEKRPVQALHAEKIPAPDSPERSRRQGCREPWQRMLVREFQVATVTCRNRRESRQESASSCMYVCMIDTPGDRIENREPRIESRECESCERTSGANRIPWIPSLESGRKRAASKTLIWPAGDSGSLCNQAIVTRRVKN